MDTDQGVSLVSHGDQFERDTWTKLEPNLSKYEDVWRMLVVPLRETDSVYLRFGVDADLETFAMNNYTAYVNMWRALDKIESKADDLKYAEEIWANLQRAIEVAIKAEAAFSKVYFECTRADSRIDTQCLNIALESVGIYRNLLHDPIPATLQDEHGTRHIPKREKLEKYSHWTRTIHVHDLSDFEPVERLLWDDFYRVCSSLQDLWKQIQNRSGNLLQNAEYQRRSMASFGGRAMYGVIKQDSSLGATFLVTSSASGCVTVSGSLPTRFKSEEKIEDKSTNGAASAKKGLPPVEQSRSQKE